MTLMQFRYLIAIVDNGFNISRAAGVLHTSQPGVSRQVRVLEQQIGTPLLARSSGRIIGLTASGGQVLARARRIVKEADDLYRMSKGLLPHESGTLEIATQHSYAVSLVPRAVAAMRRRHLGVSVVVQQAPVSVSLDMVRYGDVDVGINIEPPPPASGLVGLYIATIPLVLIAPVGHPLLRKQRLTLEDLLAHPFVGPTSSSSADWGVRRVFNAHGLELQPAISVMNAGAMQSYVAAGAGISIVPASLPRIAGVRTMAIDHLFRANTINAVLDPQRHLPSYLYDFIALLAPAWTKYKIDKTIREFTRGCAPLEGNSHAMAITTKRN